MNSLFHACLISVICTAVIGCVSVDNTQKHVADHWNSNSKLPWSNVPTTPNGIREFVYEGIAVKDFEYQRYTTLIRRGVSYGGFGAQAVAIGLSAAGGLVTGSAQVLSGAASAVNGGSAAFDKHVLYDQSITVLIAKMDALRAKKLADIQDSLKQQNIDIYTLAQAYRDVEDYGHQGTLDAALSGVAKEAGVQQAEAKGEVKPTPAPSSGKP